jgi:glycosyltransferase involved in cell wall biosynthesis
MKDGPRVVMLLEDLEFGGTQRQALELTMRLDPGLLDVELWMMRSGSDFRLPSLGAGPTLRWLARSRTSVLPGILGTARHLRSRPVDLLVLLTAIPNIWGRLLGRVLRIPRILATIRGEGGLFRQHERLLWRLADHHLCNSTALKAILLDRHAIPDSRVSVIWNGIDCQRFHPPPAGTRAAAEPIVLCVARMVPDKDPRTLVSAFKIVLDRFPAARLQLVGDGPLKGEIIAEARRTLPHGRFQFLDGTRDLLPLYHQASLLVLSSIREGFPNVVIEAMACGLPVVATRVGGLAEVVDHGRTGLLASPGSPEALAGPMVELLRDEEKRIIHGAAGRRRAEDLFSIDAAVRSHEQLFLRLLHSGSLPPPSPGQA